MLIMHLILVIASVAVSVAMLLPTLIRGASTQYYLILLLLVLVTLYGFFGIIVYYRCRFLLRVLAIASAIILGIILFQFIMSYISSIACRYDEADVTRSQIVTGKNCSGGEIIEKTNGTLECRKPTTQEVHYLLSRSNCSLVNFKRGGIEC